MFEDDEEKPGVADESVVISHFQEPIDDRNRVAPVIEFRDVHLAFDDKVILDGVSFSVRRGETKLILGRSGGGDWLFG